ncbi:trypsin-1 isoform X14 [Orussus abietinus]|uniref:trypsin-1 isoform X14 n=1 Tax=Orussus abietinus TaxID=222816 RepID=UPI000626DFFB|nr:trypsin-1 isoform X14 [Orussus abietinus]XP_012283090.1 trypsin-1 isoform X14 [Orussus abietinus]
MIKCLVLTTLAVLAAGDPIPSLVPLFPLSPGGRIVGGTDASIEDVPYQVTLQLSGFSFCGGTIVANQWVLSAAHCMGYPTSMVKVRAGSAYTASGGSLHAVEKVIVHEKYGTTPYGVPKNDVALMRLKEPLELDNTRKAISLFEQNEEAEVGAYSVITGWGVTSQGGSSPSVLQTVQVPIVSKKKCSEAYSRYGGIPPGQICAAYPEGGKDACQGDSGGPLAINGRLAGIVSWGNGCAKPGWPGVYTEVASYRDWILENSGI